MPLYKFPAVILQSYETGNTSEVVRTFSGEFGRLTLMCKGLRRPRSRLAPVLHPLATAELTIHAREGAEMGGLRDAAPLRPREGIRGDLGRLALGCLLAEIAAESCETGHPSPAAFETLEAGLDALSTPGAQPPATLALHHLIRLVTVAGYEPTIDPELLEPWAGREKPEVFWLHIEDGRIHARGRQPDAPPVWPSFPAPNAAEMPLPPPCVRALYSNVQCELEQLPLLPPLEESHAIQFIEALTRLARWHLNREIQSARFWRSLLAKGKSAPSSSDAG
ncbi:DNA repair protein RecO [Candidatus Poribacteria bacterium]|nr:DNA repair protein RecO [Candidatus Poribacteria bacterium]